MGADKAYHAQRIRYWLRAQGIGAVIPPRAPRAKKRRVGRPFSYNKERYRGRNVIERSIGWLKECRSLATRFEKLAVHYLGMVQIAIIERYLKRLTHPLPQT
jgi:transposase